MVKNQSCRFVLYATDCQASGYYTICSCLSIEDLIKHAKKLKKKNLNHDYKIVQEITIWESKLEK